MCVAMVSNEQQRRAKQASEILDVTASSDDLKFFDEYFQVAKTWKVESSNLPGILVWRVHFNLTIQTPCIIGSSPPTLLCLTAFWLSLIPWVSTNTTPSNMGGTLWREEVAIPRVSLCSACREPNTVHSKSQYRISSTEFCTACLALYWGAPGQNTATSQGSPTICICICVEKQVIDNLKSVCIGLFLIAK